LNGEDLAATEKCRLRRCGVYPLRGGAFEDLGSGATRDPHCRRAIERRAVNVERRPVQRLIACAACPGGVSAAVPEAGLMAY